MPKNAVEDHGAPVLPRRDAQIKVLFVCTANVCRSPMAEAIFNALAQDKGLPWKAASAGVEALVGKPISPRAGSVLEEIGVPLNGHRARQVSADMLDEADLTLAMTADHASTLRRLSESSSEKVHTLTAFAIGGADEDIPDPYGQSVIIHRASVRQLLGYLEEVMVRIGRGR